MIRTVASHLLGFAVGAFVLTGAFVAFCRAPVSVPRRNP